MRHRRFLGGARGTFHKIPADAQLKKIPPAAGSAIPTLHHGLDRVLFNPGVHFLRCPRTGLFNFPTHLLHPPVPESVSGISAFTSAQQDQKLHNRGTLLATRFVSSTSSATGLLSQIYFCLLGLDRGPGVSFLSESFLQAIRLVQPPSGAMNQIEFTAITKVPHCVVVTPHQTESGKTVYSLFTDPDAKQAVEEPGPGGGSEILMQMGHVFERQFTSSQADFARCLQNGAPGESSFSFSHTPNLLIRSQIDCIDDRLPGKTFDIKTRATLPLRFCPGAYKALSGYRLNSLYGVHNSFEREFFDMARSAFLKYAFQAHLGGMDGIFVAYHNVLEIFGFQYLPLAVLDEIIFGGSAGSKQIVSACVHLLDAVISAVHDQYPHGNLPYRVTFEVKKQNLMNVYVKSESPKVPFAQFSLGTYALVNGLRTPNLLIGAPRDSLEVNWSVQRVQSCISPAEYEAVRKRMQGYRHGLDKLGNIPGLPPASQQADESALAKMVGAWVE